MITESDIESAITMQLVTLGWQPIPTKPNRNVFKGSPKTQREKVALGGLRPDYILYSDSNSDQSTIIIEAKKPNESMSAALEQGKKYAKLLKTQIVIATDGYRLKSWHMEKKSPLLFNDSEIDELISKDLSLYFAKDNIFNSFSIRVAVGKKELISKFKKANDVLRAEGIDAGIVRFSEFANLMFLKLKMEDGTEIAEHSWNDLETKQGNKLLSAVKRIFSELKKQHSNLFEQTKITSPQSLEELISILSSFQLSMIREDVKGLAFEYFIHSYTQGLTNDLGQYFTPRHIIKMMVDYLRPQLGEKIYDPFCGTGGMLIECFRYIDNRIDKKAKGDKIKLQQKTIYGCDNSSVARIAMMNMIMFGDGHSNIVKGDSYKKHAENKNKYDVVIANIPFSQKTKFYESYPVSPASDEQNGDSIGLQHCLESLKKSSSARAAIIVPIGLLYKDALSKEREYVLKNFNLERVVELTPKCFNPYTEQQTAILMLKQAEKIKGKVQSTTSFMYFKVKNDGFSQDGYRVAIHGTNDIDNTIEDVGGIKVIPSSDNGYKFKNINVFRGRNTTRLKDIAIVRPGDSISPKTQTMFVTNGKYPIYMVADLAVSHITYCLNKSKYLINDIAIKDKDPYKYPVDTIIIGNCGKAALKNHRALLSESGYLTGTLTGIIADIDKVHPYCLFYFFMNFDVENITYDLGYPGITKSIIENIPIPNELLGKSPKTRKIITQITEIIKMSKVIRTKHIKLIQ